MKPFMDEDFCLETETARVLYHRYAKDMPIIDYHNHLIPELIAKNHRYSDLGELWLAGDHYKWRAMRSAGIDEKFCTGPTSSKEKFMAWASVVPQTIGNPLYHWTHLELKRYFGIDELLSPKTAESIWERASGAIAGEGFSTRELLARMKVAVVCTTDDPADSLEHHRAYAKETEGTDAFSMFPTFRPDKAHNTADPAAWNAYIEKLGEAAGTGIGSYRGLLEALEARHDFFDSMGCRLSDHGIQRPFYEPAGDADLEAMFSKLRAGKKLDALDAERFATGIMLAVAKMNHRRGWTMQLHMGAIRNNSSRMFRLLGPDTGFDSIADEEIAVKLARFLDALDTADTLPQTILYVLNPRDNYLIGTMIGNFQGGRPGKIQFGSGWWFNDQKEGMEQQMNALANLGLLSRFVGMLTDSRSFLSFPRHEYFRRILANLVGGWVEKGEAPWDEEFLGGMMKDISFRNAASYFGFPIRMKGVHA